MLGQRRRRWASIEPTLSDRLVFAGLPLHTVLNDLLSDFFWTLTLRGTDLAKYYGHQLNGAYSIVGLSLVTPGSPCDTKEVIGHTTSLVTPRKFYTYRTSLATLTHSLISEHDPAAACLITCATVRSWLFTDSQGAKFTLETEFLSTVCYITPPSIVCYLPPLSGDCTQ